MSDEPFDYTSCTLAELRDVAAHIDRKRFPDRAAQVDSEIHRRESLPIDQQEPISFYGGFRAGISLFFEKTATWPLIELTFSTTFLAIKPSSLAMMQPYNFTREQVPRIVQHHSLLIRGFQFMHTCRAYPPVILFLAIDPEGIRNALVERRWHVESAE